MEALAARSEVSASSGRLERMRFMKRFLLAFALAAALLSLLAAPALADRVYHSQHIVLMSDTGATVGFVENIHANGPTIYAQERYVLLGAEPGTYTVTLTISSPSLPDPLVLTKRQLHHECSGKWSRQGHLQPG